ncbi:MAG: hypothetical protein EOP10_21670 [Proteobacteria bacterium]|nr:MAG: hypothetical protein EOP10_21670 [Pseudomonadota bacterium]
MSLLLDLEKNEYISRTNVRIIEQYCARWGVSAYHGLLDTHILTEHDLADAIAETYSVDRLFSYDKNDVDLNVLERVSYADALKFQICVPHRDEKGTYVVYIVDPTDTQLMNYLDQNLIAYKLVVVDLTLIMRSIEESYPIEFQLPTLAQTQDPTETLNQ